MPLSIPARVLCVNVRFKALDLNKTPRLKIAGLHGKCIFNILRNSQAVFQSDGTSSQSHRHCPRAWFPHHCFLFITRPSGHSSPSTCERCPVISISFSYWLCWASFHVFFGYLSIIFGVIFTEFLVKFNIVFCGWVIRTLYIFWINLPYQVLEIIKGWHGYLETISYLGGSRDTTKENYGSAQSTVSLTVDGIRLSSYMSISLSFICKEYIRLLKLKVRQIF